LTTSNENSNNFESSNALAEVIDDLRPYFWRPFLISSMLLLLVVAFITDYNTRQSEQALGEQMADKGLRALWLFENVVMEKILFISPEARNDYLQRLGTQDDFSFIAVTNNQGKFLVHTDMKKIGSSLTINDPDTVNFWTKIEHVLPNTDKQGTRWGFVTINNEHLFLVHRIYGENTRQGEFRYSHPELAEFIATQNVNHIFAAINADAFQNEIDHRRKKALTVALWILGGASVVVWIISLINRIIVNRKAMRVAEKTITSMKREVLELEEEVIKREKLAAIGNLAAGVAHEIRNPLSSIKGYATYFAEYFAEDTNEHKAAQIMVQEAERLNRVVGELLGVSRPTDIKKSEIPIDTVLDSCADLLQADLKQSGIVLKITGRGKIVNIDPDRIKQAILNICLNALEAIRDEKQKGQNTKQYCMSIDVTELEKNFCITIKDNGPGIDKDLVTRIFDPYFTTKSEGTGLGLSNVRKILEAHGGSIEVESEKGVGTVFSLYVPKRG
jgi:two-component system sensor histidine kinase HydH